MLAAFQLAMNRIDWKSKAAIDIVFGADPAAMWKPASAILLLAVLAFFVRVASRWFMFNAGRDAEYELRFELLRKLHQLGTAFYRKMPAGEIMSRSTSDLQQVRMLLGFGILNLVERLLRVRERAADHARRQHQAHARVPRQPAARDDLLPRGLARPLHAHARQPGRARPHERRAAGQPRRRARRAELRPRAARARALRGDEPRLPRRRASRSRACAGRCGPTIGAVAAIGILVFFWYGSSLAAARARATGGISQGAFFAFWSAFARMTWPMIAVGLRAQRRPARARRVRAPARRVRRRARGRRRASPRAEARRAARFTSST